MRYHSLPLILLAVAMMFSIAEAGDDSIDITYTGSTLWSRIYQMSVQGNNAFCAMHHGLMVFDISNVADPQFVSKYYINDGAGSDISVIGNYAYMAAGSEGLLIFDISNVSSPLLIGQYVDSYGRAEYVTVEGDYAYVAGFMDEVDIIDISDRTAPFQVGTIIAESSIRTMIVQGDYLLCGTYRGLEVFDIADPSLPDSIAVFFPEGTCRALAIEDTLAYLVNDTAVFVASISDLANPFQVGYMPLGFSSFSYREFHIIGDYAYMSDGDYDPDDGSGGLIIIDIFDPKEPAIVNQLQQDIWRMSDLGDKLWITDLGADYFILELTDPENPSVAGEMDIPHTRSWGFRGIETNGRYAYLAYGPSDLYVVDISDPENMIPIEGDFLSGGAFELELSRGWLFVASGSYGNEGLYVFETYNPYNPGLPIEVGYYPYNSPQEVTIVGDYAFMAGNSGTSIILDISQPFDPQLVSDYRAGGITWGIAVEGDYAYLANMQGLIIVDVSNIDEPVVADTIAEAYEDLYDAIIYKGYLVTGGNYAFKVRDISNPLSPVTVAQIDVSADVNGLTPYGNYIMAAIAVDGLAIIDMTTPTAPAVIGMQTISGEAQDVAFYGEHAFVVDQFGLMSFWVDLPACCVLGGDANFNDYLGMGDVVFLINLIFKDGLHVNCKESADINGDCTVDIGDPVFLINHLLRQGPAPVCSECIKADPK